MLKMNCKTTNATLLNWKLKLPMRNTTWILQATN
jgi:hypothetical protein